MIKIQKIFKSLIVTAIVSLSLVGCTMQNHKIAVNIINAKNEATIFDKTYRGDAVSSTINYLVYTSNDGSKKSWIEQNKDVLKNYNEALVDDFFVDFQTRSKDTYVTRFDILNDFIDEKMTFNDKEVKMVSGIKHEAIAEAPWNPIEFNLYFQGVEKLYKFTGSVIWNYKITNINNATANEGKPVKLWFLWIYKSDKNDFKITNFEISK